MRYYKGKKRLAKKAMSKYAWEYMRKYGVPKIGDITHDCDGWNHVVDSVMYSWNAVYTKNSWVKGKVAKQSRKTKILEVDCGYEGGNWVCTCHTLKSDFGFKKPKPIPDIKEYCLGISREFCLVWK